MMAAEKGAENWPKSLLGVREQRAITLVLLATAVLLVLVPGAYCWLDQGRAEMADKFRRGAHRAQAAEGSCYTCQAATSGHHRPPLQVGRDYVNEVVSGGTNGLLMMVATVLGGIGADIPGRGIFAMGTASLAAYGFSMGFSTFMVESAKEEFAVSQLNEEYQEVQSMPLEEVSEMICHYKKRGLSEDDAKMVANVLSRYEDFWVQHMMAEELGIALPRGDGAAASSGLATCTSFLIFGMIPLLGVTVSLGLDRCRGPQWYRPQFSTVVALGLSAMSLVLLGVAISHVAGSRTPLGNSMLMLANGCAASVLAFWISQACSRLTRSCSEGTNGAPCGADDGARQAPVPLVPAAAPAAAAVAGVHQELGHTVASSSASADGAAWPSFRRRFFQGLCALWVAFCSVTVCAQLVERAAYDSLRVFAYGGLTCVTTGLGAVPFMFVGAQAVGEGPLAVANAVASGMMLAASACMLLEAHEHCGPMDWQILAGLLAGGLFIRASELLHGGDDDQDDVVALHSAFVERRHLRKAMLIFTVMFCHSAAEGVAVGVAFSRHLRSQFGLYVSLLLAVHNVPEGLAVALVLVPRGVSATLASLIAILTSVPQPLLAVAAFLFVDAFRWLLPLGLAFAAGAMVYVCLRELLNEAAEQLGWSRALAVTLASFVSMSLIIAMLHALTGD